MGKFIRKLKVVICIMLLLFVSLRSKPVKAEAFTMSALPMTLSALNPAIIPVALIGLAAVLLLGFTVSNWDEIVAFGNSVVQELQEMGHSISDFVSGMSVKIDDTFKKAAKNASVKLGDNIDKYTPGTKV
ncbi:hypothetical protein, partial [Streptococcus ovuberis]